MARRRRKKVEESSGGNWLTTFSDLMSLLLTFFILLFSMSSVAEDDISAASGSFQQGFMGGGASVLDGHGITELDTAAGNGEGEVNGPGDDKGEDFYETSEPDHSTDIVENFEPEGSGDTEYQGESSEFVEDYEPESGGDTAEFEETEITVETRPQSDIPQAVQETHERAQNIIRNQGYGDKMSSYSDSRGVYLYIHESILFNPGQSEITTTGRQTLNSLTELLNRSDNDILIEGFTDDVPISNSQYPSNWELSAGRAMAVVRYYAENQNVNPARLSGRGYGEHHPIVPNESEANRSLNRRVNIVLVYQGEEN